MSGEGVAQGVAGDALAQIRGLRGGVHRPLHHRLVPMMSSLESARLVAPAAARRKDPLPEPLLVRVRELSLQGGGEGHRSETGVEILCVYVLYVLEVVAQRRDRGLREDGDAIALPLRIADEQLAAREVDVLHAQAQSFQQTQTAAVEQQRNQLRNAGDLIEQRAHFLR